MTTIPDAARIAPCVSVQLIDGNKWSVSVRGFNGRFSNKLLVLMDGRSLYAPSFASVFSDILHTDLEDIKRIKVIRGTGATLWGANAVNGVINIITKSAADSQGGLLIVGGGHQQNAFATARHGAKPANRQPRGLQQVVGSGRKRSGYHWPRRDGMRL